ncbi:hypothetical protein B0H63DRAFT_531803 [Podospora didyma]|uniref:Uncharacterized protein n=1 Tax=Podospora didyma TaxID=330526 RepID=A0AAE0P601_9PEZI|nr:hypothetical protein B0H63DRAFT_531803 [Podospora didyma]
MTPGLGKLVTAALPLAARGPYSSFSTTALIPWNERTIDWSSNVHVQIKVGALGSSGKSYIPIVDTGANGGTKGWEFLSWSKVPYEGCRIPQIVYFNYQASSPNPAVKTNVPILAATHRIVCETMGPKNVAGPFTPRLHRP